MVAPLTPAELWQGICGAAPGYRGSDGKKGLMISEDDLVIVGTILEQLVEVGAALYGGAAALNARGTGLPRGTPLYALLDPVRPRRERR